MVTNIYEINLLHILNATCLKHY